MPTSSASSPAAARMSPRRRETSCRRSGTIRMSPAIWTTSTSTCVPAPMMRWAGCGRPNTKTSRRPFSRPKMPASASIDGSSNQSRRKMPMIQIAASHRWPMIAVLGAASLMMAGCLIDGRAAAQAQDSTDPSIELIDPKVLRVCADPRNMPFSNEKGEGFENKLAELFASKLNKRLDYMFFPQATGFVRMTLGAHRCDVIMGFPQGDDLVQGTNPYYRTAYALVAKSGSGLEDVATLDDARLKSKHIGIVAGTPPATNMAVNGLMANAKPYPLMIDTRVDSSAATMINDLKT